MILKKILRGMLQDAYAHRGVERKHTLERGLTLRIYITSIGRVSLMLQRDNVLPAMDEWLKVMNNWPWPLPEKLSTPQEKHHGRVHGLTASWPLLDEKYQQPLPAAPVAAEVEA